MERVPYIKDELKVLGHYPSFDPALPGGNIYNTPVSPRENTLAFLHGEKPLWTPMSTDGVTLIPRHVPDNVARALVFDTQPLKPEERIGGPDMFGIEWVYVPTVSGSMVRPGNPTLKDVNEWPNYIKEPDISAWGWEEAAVRNAAFIGTGRAMTAWIMTGLFERLISFMDFEPAALALIDEDQQDALHRLFDFLCSVYEKQIDRYQTYFGADIIYFHDDWGAQRSPFFSLDVCRDMLVPHLRRLSDYCHSKGMFLNLHSCGAVGKLIPAMIDAHVDIWSGQDYNDKKNLLDMYGDKITIEIGPPPPLSAAPGSKQPTPDEIAAAAEKWMDIYGKSGKRAFASTRMAPDSYGESIYEQSRILLNTNFV
jgi:hypothetical protein